MINLLGLVTARGSSTSPCVGFSIGAGRTPGRATAPVIGILRLGRQYGADWLEAACDRGLDIGARSYGSIQSILKHGLDKQPARAARQGELLPDHPNIRGSRYTIEEALIVLTHPTLDQMHQLGLAGMARAFAELEANPQSADLSHAEWLGPLLDREATDRIRAARLRARLRYARLRHQAAVEDVDYPSPSRPRPRTVSDRRW